MKLFFGQVLCPSSGVYSLYTQQWCMSYRFVDSFHSQKLSTNLYNIHHCWVHSE